MSRPQPGESQYWIDGESLRALLALALGRPLPEIRLRWASLLSLAIRERVAGVIWSRSASAVRKGAPPEIASRWQRCALVLGLHSRRQLKELAAAIRALRAHDVPAVVLKGAPLAQRLYGDFTVRPTLDADLYVPLEHRAAAADALGEIGWRRMSARWPEEEKFERQSGDHTFVLEVHSSPIDDASLDHICFPVEQRPATVGEHTLPAHDGRFLPAYLAAHLLKHHEKPLLWAVDFTVLWSSLDDPTRADAVRAAREVGLQRHLAWAVALAGDIRDAGALDVTSSAAVSRLQRVLAPKSDLQRVMQLAMLSASPAHACRVVSGRLWPAAWRQGWRAAPAYFAGRAVRWTYRHLVFERPFLADGGLGDERPISFADADCVQRLCTALSESPRVWVSSVGENMTPAVPPYALARIAPLGERPLEVGDVVVIRSAATQCSLERVISLGDELVYVKSDAHLTRECGVSRRAILGVCDVVRVGDQSVPVDRRPFGNLGLMRAIVRARISKAAATPYQA